MRFIVPVRKVVCRDCRAATYERVAFAAYKSARITRLLAKKLLARAEEVGKVSIQKSEQPKRYRVAVPCLDAIVHHVRVLDILDLTEPLANPANLKQT